MTASPRIIRVLDASTAHLPHEIRDCLNDQDGVIADERKYGWLLWVPENVDNHLAEYLEDEEDDNSKTLVPEAVIDIWRYAVSQNCEYVLLDAAANAITGLPTYAG